MEVSSCSLVDESKPSSIGRDDLHFRNTLQTPKEPVLQEKTYCPGGANFDSALPISMRESHRPGASHRAGMDLPAPAAAALWERAGDTGDTGGGYAPVSSGGDSGDTEQ